MEKIWINFLNFKKNPNYIKYLSKIFISIQKLNKFYTAIIILILEILVTALIYFQGGTHSSCVQLFYFPILLSGFAFGISGGIWVGCLSAFMTGPYMPVYQELHMYQSSFAWIMRGFFFNLIGTISGIWTTWAYYYFKNLQENLSKDSLTGLPNLIGLEILKDYYSIQKNLDYPLTYLQILFNQLQDVEVTFGSDIFQNVLNEIQEKFTSFLPHDVFLAYTDHATFSLLIPSFYSAENIKDQCIFYFEDHFLMKNLPFFIEIYFSYVPVKNVQERLFSLSRKAKSAIIKSVNKGNKTSIFSDEDETQVKNNIRLIQDLKRIFGDHKTSNISQQFFLVYQPQIQLQTGLCIGFEVLIRWNHPDMGLILPHYFIPLIEKTPLIHLMTRWIVKTALRDLKKWHKQGFKLKISINFSIKNFDNPKLFTYFFNLLKTLNIPGDLVCIEITETAFSCNLEKVSDLIEKCQKNKVQIAIDDFGTGQSSLKYFLHLKVNCLKIDQIFIKSLEIHSNAKSIIKNIIDLGKKLNINVIAEGIENDQEFKILKQIGCPSGQGFFLSPPLEYDQMTLWLMKNEKIRMNL